MPSDEILPGRLTSLASTIFNSFSPLAYVERHDVDRVLNSIVSNLQAILQDRDTDWVNAISGSPAFGGSPKAHMDVVLKQTAKIAVADSVRRLRDLADAMERDLPIRLDLKPTGSIRVVGEQVNAHWESVHANDLWKARDVFAPGEPLMIYPDQWPVGTMLYIMEPLNAGPQNADTEIGPDGPADLT